MKTFDALEKSTWIFHDSENFQVKKRRTYDVWKCPFQIFFLFERRMWTSSRKQKTSQTIEFSLNFPWRVNIKKPYIKSLTATLEREFEMLKGRKGNDEANCKFIVFSL